MSIKIALIGNPNCGKTTLFNHLTGASEHVGNWPGVTTEKKEKKLKFKEQFSEDVEIVDLPGIYSLLTHCAEEKVSRDFLIKNKPDIVLNVVDGTNLERNLYLTTQLLDLNIPLIVAISKTDLIKKNNILINYEVLSKKLNCEVLALEEKNLKHNLDTIKSAIKKSKSGSFKINNLMYSEKLEKYLGEISNTISNNEKIKKDNIKFASIKLFEKDDDYFKWLELSEIDTLLIKETIRNAEEDFDEECCGILINERYKYIDKICAQCYQKPNGELNLTNKIDSCLTHPIFSIIVLILIITSIYIISITLIGKPFSDWLNVSFFENFLKPLTTELLVKIKAANWLINLITDGIISGVGSVLSFVPQIGLIFLFLSILEDCGYMPRVAFILDKIFKKFGLSGKSAISFLISSGCGVTGILATKTIESKKERLATIATTTFIPCNAKLPIIAGICGLFFPNNFFIAPLIYFLCFFVVLISGLIFKKRKSGTTTECFISELPPYCIPSPKQIFSKTIFNIKLFILKAGTIVLLASIFLWFLANFGPTNQLFEISMAEKDNSFLAMLGKSIAPIFAPLGFFDWRLSVATISGLIAKENIISSLGIVSCNASNKINDIFSNSSSALSFLMFNLLCAPCCAAISSIYYQTNSLKLTSKILAFQTAMAYLVALIINKVGSIFQGSYHFNFFTLIIITVLITILILIKNHNEGKLHND